MIHNSKAVIPVTFNTPSDYRFTPFPEPGFEEHSSEKELIFEVYVVI